MTREEAIKIANEMYGWVKTDREREALETLVPELAESEDERIRKQLIDAIKIGRSNSGISFTEEAASRYIAWLEKHSEEEIRKIRKEEYTNGFNDAAGFEKQKEQDKCPEYCVRSHCIGCSIYEKEKEKWPIMDVFGFKVGDAVRLKDGDGRKHIIKSFEEVEGVHGPNFYHVEFEDNSARDGIYPGEEYPNGYYTQMEKLEEEQKPAEWSEDYDEENLQTRFAFYTYKDDPSTLYLSNVFVEEASHNHGFGTRILKAAEKVAEVIGAITICLKVKQDSPANNWYRKHGYAYMTFEDGYDWLEKNLEYMKPNKQEWSDEDEKTLNAIIDMVGNSLYEPLRPRAMMLSWLNSLRPQSHWKPTEEQMKALRECGECKRCIKELYEDLQKRYGTC